MSTCGSKISRVSQMRVCLNVFSDSFWIVYYKISYLDIKFLHWVAYVNNISLIIFNKFQNCTYIQNPGKYLLLMWPVVIIDNFALVIIMCENDDIKNKEELWLKKCVRMLTDIFLGFPSSFETTGACSYTFSTSTGFIHKVLFKAFISQHLIYNISFTTFNSQHLIHNI